MNVSYSWCDSSHITQTHISVMKVSYRVGTYMTVDMSVTRHD